MAAEDAERLIDAHVVDDRRPRVVLRRAHEPLGRVREAERVLRDRRHLAAPEEVERRVVGAGVARLVDRRGERVGPRAVHGVVDRLDARREVLHAPRPRRLRVGDDLLARRAVVPRVVEDAVVAGMRAGDDRRVVGERDGRQRRHRAVAERDAHLDEARDVRAPRRARPCRRARWSSCRRTGSRRRGAGARAGSSTSVERVAVLHGEVACPSASAARSRAARRSWARRRRGAPRAGTRPSVAHALAADHERRPRLHEPERAVLAEVAALVLPVVRGGVEHAEVGRGGRVEELGDLVERVRVGVVGAVRVRVGALVVEADELVGRLVGERVAARRPRSARSRRPAGAAERDPAVGARAPRSAPSRCGAAPCRRSGSSAGSRSTSSAASAASRCSSAMLVGASRPCASSAQPGAVMAGAVRPVVAIPAGRLSVSGSRSSTPCRRPSVGTAARTPNLREASSLRTFTPEARRHQPRLARDRRRGRGPRPARHRGRHPAARQAQADLGARTSTPATT